MFTIDFPEFSFKVKTENGKRYIYDIARKKHVVITPEEWVRQNILHYLTEVKKYPLNFIAVEYALQLNGLNKRADILIYNAYHTPVLIIECKKPEIALNQNIFIQAARYNLTLKVPFIAITNGTENMLAKVDFENETHEFLNDFPAFETL
jgi:type I site-specific restriction endonuclease